MDFRSRLRLLALCHRLVADANGRKTWPMGTGAVRGSEPDSEWLDGLAPAWCLNTGFPPFATGIPAFSTRLVHRPRDGKGGRSCSPV